MSVPTVYLIPAPLYELETQSIPHDVQAKAVELKYYFVENIRTARRVLKAFDKSVAIDAITFEVVNNKEEINTAVFKKWLSLGYDIGIMSEAGMPAFADPGSVLVALAHEKGAKVMPFTGPSSLMLALVASGLNGQHFEFHGYLPIEKSGRTQYFKNIEKSILQSSLTHIFIETPYRNSQLFDAILAYFPSQVKLCIGFDITSSSQTIVTKTIQDWKKNKASYDLHKKPCIFLLGV